MAGTQSLSTDQSAVSGAGQAGPFFSVAFSCDALTEPVRFELGGISEVRVGRGDSFRHETSGGVLRIELAEPSLSRDHFVLTRCDGWQLADSGSKNGTFVAGGRVDTAPVASGDVIEAGLVFFVFRAGVNGLEPTGAPRTLDALPEQALAATLHPGLQRTVEVLGRMASSAVPILIHGESGTGKELAARTVHELSGRGGPYVAVNCGALTETLANSELFGHKKGAFSGATADSIGLVRRADGGTLFLDEIAELSESTQVALLRVLQEREVLPVGDTKPVGVDIRVVAATHRDLAALSRQERFRHDLYGRISGFVVSLPALRDRPEDLGVLVHRLLPGGTRGGARVSRNAARKLFNHRWPLNVRELAHALETAVALADGDKLRLRHLPESVRDPAQPAADEPPSQRAQLEQLLREHAGNVSAVARALATSRTQVSRLVERFGIDLSQYR